MFVQSVFFLVALEPATDYAHSITLTLHLLSGKYTGVSLFHRQAGLFV